MDNLEGFLAIIDTFGTIGVLGLVIWSQGKTIQYERDSHNQTKADKDSITTSFIDFLKSLSK